MDAKRRLKDLEKTLEPQRVSYRLHIYTPKDETGDHTRENCEMCAAMTDEEYAAYCGWCARQPKNKMLALAMD